MLREVKYGIIIPDGAADRPLAELGGRTPMEAARTPNLDRLAREGRVARCVTTPPGFGAGSDVCSMCLLGYDPAVYHTGRAPLEAAALGVAMGETDWVFRVNLVSVGEGDWVDGPAGGGGVEGGGVRGAGAMHGAMLDHSGGGITQAEAEVLVADLAAHWLALDGGAFGSSLSLTPGVQYRHILKDSSGERAYAEVLTTPPHEIPGEAWRGYLPAPSEDAGRGGEAAAALLRRLVESSAAVLMDHPVNVSRVERGLRPANLAWVWGQGVRPAMPTFAERYGLRGVMLTAVDLLAGIASLIGWDRVSDCGASSYHATTDYAKQGRAACDALDVYDVVCCHVESPDEASHQGDWKSKVEAIEAIDEHVVGPMVEKLRSFGDPRTDAEARGWRLMVLPDHATCVSTKKHDATPVPVLLAGTAIRSAVERGFDEQGAAESDLCVDPGHELMEYFLFGGLARVPYVAPSEG